MEKFSLSNIRKLLGNNPQVTLGEYLVIGIGFAIPISTTLTGIFSGLALICWIFSDHPLKLIKRILSNPLTCAGFILLLILLMGIIYTPVSVSTAFSVFKKYRELLFMAVFMSFLTTERNRKFAFLGFMFAMCLNLIISYFGAIAQPDAPEGTPVTAFKNEITYSILVAYFAFWTLVEVVYDKKHRKIMMILFSLTVFNLFFIGTGRTGYVLFIILLALFVFHKFNWKVGIGGLLAVFLIFIGVISFSDNYRAKFMNFVNEFVNSDYSIGLRKQYYKYSWELIKQRPILGFGTGSFESEYKKITDQAGNPVKTSNPHNEYLMIGVQTGFIGIIGFLYFLFCHWKWSLSLSYREKLLAQALILLFAIGCIPNSLLLDHTEGMLFVFFSSALFGPYFKSKEVQSNNGILNPGNTNA